MNPNQVTAIYYFCVKERGVHEVLGEKQEHQQSGQDRVQPFPLPHPRSSEDLVQDRAGLGCAVFFGGIPRETSVENAVLLSKCVGIAGYRYV